MSSRNGIEPEDDDRADGPAEPTIQQDTEYAGKFSGGGEIQGLMIVCSYGHLWYKEARLMIDRKHKNAAGNGLSTENAEGIQ